MIIAQPGFLPARLPDLFQWCSCRRSNITLNGSAVSQINDLSGNNNHWVQSTAANQPLFTSLIDGAKVMTFDGINDNMLSALSFPKGNYSIFVVFKSTDTRGSFISRDDSGFGDIDTLFGLGLQNLFPATDGHVTFERHTSSPNRFTGASSVIAYNDNATHFAGVVVDGFDADLYTDDVVVNTAGDISQCFKGLQIRLGIGFNAVSNPYSGDIAETIIYDRAISDTEVGFIKEYMMRMWAI